MKVTIFKNRQEKLSRDYCLTNTSIPELVNGLINHCEAVNVDPRNAAIEIEIESSGDKTRSYIVKGTSDVLDMRSIAKEILTWELAA